MPLNVPTTTATRLGTVEITEDSVLTHYQQFVLTTPSGTSLGSVSSPIPVSITLDGATASILPAGAVYNEELFLNNGIELNNGDSTVLRSTVRGSLKTAGDGRVNELVSSIGTGYDDIYVVEDTFDSNSLTPITVSGSFFDTSRTNARFVYVPMIRSGWRKLSFSVKTPAAGALYLYADLGFLTNDLLVYTDTITANIRHGFVADSIPVSGSVTSIPMLASPVNGFIIGFTPDSATAGFFEIHLVRGS